MTDEPLTDEPLKPCPFCGSVDVALRADGGIGWIVCRTCRARGPEDGSPEFGAETVAWNRRANEDKDARLHVANLLDVVDILLKGYADQRLAPMPSITAIVVENASRWLDPKRVGEHGP